MRTNDEFNPVDLRSAFAARLTDPFLSESLFDHLSDIVYFVKDDAGRYVVVNETLVKRCGKKKKSELIGKNASDLFDDATGARFLEQDLALIRSRAPLVNELERHPYTAHSSGWCLTTKLPLSDPQGNVIGLVGMSRDLQSPGDDASDLNRLAQLIEHAKTHLDQPLRVNAFAKQVGMSNYQLDRRCREVYGVSPSQLILQLRMGAAATKLRQTRDPILSIALDVGYSDQSAFTRQFRRTFGVSPGKYRG
ncbi:AraC family transcriptional regulator [Stieleria sp. TO1_6]|uniref:AraC family transcriptional regulator n=1 Tax=Stieleria tagensis TaxID=2956795 RepID=UPI00209B1F86|nr:AraC family transcriptional regulator [Stieleria tagensis]MCO8124485.1 AraC family transcriptional regulator [Stieleria tagensis]